MTYEEFAKAQNTGKIIREQAYAQGKMIDHSDFKGQLPNNCMPSDIDMVIDYKGKILFVEFSSKHAEWDCLSQGQRLLYENIVRAGQGKITAALCKHSVEETRQINSIKDVESFQVLYLKDGELAQTNVISGSRWLEGVKTILGVE